MNGDTVECKIIEGKISTPNKHFRLLCVSPRPSAFSAVNSPFVVQTSVRFDHDFVHFHICVHPSRPAGSVVRALSPGGFLCGSVSLWFETSDFDAPSGIGISMVRLKPLPGGASTWTFPFMMRARSRMPLRPKPLLEPSSADWPGLRPRPLSRIEMRRVPDSTFSTTAASVAWECLM